MKKTSWILTFLIMLPIVYAQTPSPFGQLQSVWEAIANLLSLQFVTTSDQLAAVIRLFLFIIIYTILHEILKLTLGTGVGGVPALEHKALNVIAIAISVFVAIILPMELLVKGSFILLSVLGVGILILLYWGLHGGTKNLSPGWAAGVRTLTLLVFLWIIWEMGKIGENPTGITIGNVNLNTLTSANQLFTTMGDFKAWVLTIIWIGIFINLGFWFVHAGGPSAAGAAATRLPPMLDRTGGRKGLRAFFPTLLNSPAQLAQQKIKDLQALLLVTSQNLARDNKTELDKNATSFNQLLTALLKYDEDALQRMADWAALPTGLDPKIVKKLKALTSTEENILIAIFRLNVPQKIQDAIIPRGNIGAKKAALIATLDKTRPLLVLLQKLNEATTTATVAAGARGPAGGP